METMIAFRDAAFWWVGCWALFTVLDRLLLAVACHILHRRRRDRERRRYRSRK